MLPGHPYSAQPLQRRRRRAEHRLPELAVEGVDVERHEQGNVFEVRAERRQRDRQHVESIVEVLAEPAGLDLLFEVAVRRRDHAHVHGDVVRAADALERLLFEEAQQLRLQRRHHLADLVEKHGAAVGRLEQAPLLLACVGEGPALVPEELAFEQRVGNRRARDVHERTVRAVAAEMQHLRREVLAGAALARQEHRRCRAERHAPEQVAQRDDGRRLADDALEREGLRLAGAQHAELAPQACRLERLLDQPRHVVQVERLVGEVIRADLHRLDGRVDGGVSRQENDEDVGVVLLDLAEDGRRRRCRAACSRAGRGRRLHGRGRARRVPWTPRRPDIRRP